MQPAEPAAAAVTILASYLPAIADDDVRARCSPGLRDLYEVVGERLAADGLAGVFADFVRDPQTDFRVRRVLAVAVAADTGFAGRLAGAVAAARPADRFGTADRRGGHRPAVRARVLRRTPADRAGRARAGATPGGGLGGVLAKFRGRF